MLQLQVLVAVSSLGVALRRGNAAVVALRSFEVSFRAAQGAGFAAPKNPGFAGPAGGPVGKEHCIAVPAH